MKTNFDTIRLEAIQNFTELVEFLNSGVKGGKCTVSAATLRPRIETVRNNLIAIASCYDTDEEYRFLLEEIIALKKLQVERPLAGAYEQSVRDVVKVLEALFEVPEENSSEVVWMSAGAVIEFLRKEQLIPREREHSFTAPYVGAALQKLGFARKSVRQHGQARYCYGILRR